jgi:hypothetical protein
MFRPDARFVAGTRAQPSLSPAVSQLRLRFSPANVASGLVKLLIATAIIVALVPPLRTWAAPHLGFVIDPLRRVTTQDRVNSIARFVERETRVTGHAPQDRDLPHILKRMFPNRHDVVMDPWGRRYYLQRRASAFQVGSAGPDQRRGTRDDVLSRPRPISPPREAAVGH